MKMKQFAVWSFPIGSALVGAIAWCGWMPAIALAVVMPIAVSLQKSRRAAFWVAFGYYAGASWPLIPGAKAFFGPNVTWIESALLWLISSYLLALSFGVFWTNSIRLRPFGISLALIAVAVPPIGVIGWASPLTAAGILFPGTAWLGLAATFILCSSAYTCPRGLTIGASILFVIAHVIYHQPAPPASWRAIDTRFGAGFSESDPRLELEMAETIQNIIRNSDSIVLIFPEMSIRRWNDAAEAFWQPTLNYLKESNKTVLIGAGLSLRRQGQSYLNTVVIFGSHPTPPFVQRIPVPIAMWKPYKPSEGVPLQLFAPSTTTIAGKRAAIPICYEQLLAWPNLASAAQNPDIIIGIANDYWAIGTPIADIQQACLRSYATLFRVPLVSATNLPTKP